MWFPDKLSSANVDFVSVCNLKGCYYLVDAGYANANGFLVPYRGQRYHLGGWTAQNPPHSTEEYFSMRHAKARNIIKRCLGRLKGQWGILRSPSYFPIKTQC